MRIISGELGGRRFSPPVDHWPTRPTTDISREALFNILQFRINIEDTKFLDLFGGTGAHCYEMISRGCNDATYVDKHVPAIKFVKKTAEEFKIEDKITIILSDVLKFISQNSNKYDYIFAGPPYPWPHIPELPDNIFNSNILTDDGLFIMEHNQKHNFEQHPHFSEVRKYGQTHFSFFE